MTTPGATPSPVAVTGAGGFIGSRVCERLAADGSDVVGLDSDVSAAARVEAAGARFVACDVTDPEGVAQALAGVRGVVHTAAIVSDWGEMDEFVRVNVEGTRNVLDAAPADARVVHVSSVAIWGHSFDEPVHEDDPPRRQGVPYIDTKGDSDVLALERGAAVVRPGDVYGPGSIQWAVRPIEGLRRRLVAVPAHGIVTPVYVDDLVDCIVLALTHPDAAGQAFVAWEGPPVPVREFFEHYARMLGRRRVPVLPARVLDAAAVVDEALARRRGRDPTVTRWAVAHIDRRHAYRARRAQDVLGWHPRTSLDEGMRRTEAWARETGLID